MKFPRAAFLIVLVAQAQGFQLSMSSTGYFESMSASRGSSVKPGSYAPSSGKIADSRSGNSYLDGLKPGPGMPANNVAPSYGGSSYSSSYTSSQSNPISLGGPRSSSVAAAIPASSSNSYLTNLGVGSSSVASARNGYFSPSGKKMADGKSGNSYLDGLKGAQLSSANYAPSTRSVAAAPSANSVAPVRAASSGSYLANLSGAGRSVAPVQQDTYSFAGRQMADGKSGNSYLDGLKGKQLSSSFPVSNITPEPTHASTIQPAPAGSYLSSMGGIGNSPIVGKPSNYVPHGRKMTDAKSGNNYLDGLKGKQLTSPSYATSTPAPIAQTRAPVVQIPGPMPQAPAPVVQIPGPMPQAPYSGSYLSSLSGAGNIVVSASGASYLPAGRKMADSRSGNNYLDGLKGQSMAPSWYTTSSSPVNASPFSSSPVTSYRPAAAATPSYKPAAAATPSYGAVPATPSIRAVPSTPSYGAIPATSNHRAVPTTPSNGAISAPTPSNGAVRATPSYGVVPTSPSYGAVPATPSLRAVPATPSYGAGPATSSLRAGPATRSSGAGSFGAGTAPSRYGAGTANRFTANVSNQSGSNYLGGPKAQEMGRAYPAAARSTTYSSLYNSLSNASGNAMRPDPVQPPKMQVPVVGSRSYLAALSADVRRR